MIVDDIDFNVYSLETLLYTFYPFKIDKASNGIEALDIVKKKYTHDCCKTHKLIFMDIEMPEKNG
jgi:CheY-like chemotaxis protein